MKPDLAGMLSRLRHEKNLNQRQAAEELGISQALLSHYENGVREPRLEFIVRACDYYGVTADYLIGRSSELYEQEAGAAAEIKDALAEFNDNALSSAVEEFIGLETMHVLDMLKGEARPYHDAARALLEAKIRTLAGSASPCTPHADVYPGCDASAQAADSAEEHIAQLLNK